MSNNPARFRVRDFCVGEIRDSVQPIEITGISIPSPSWGGSAREAGRGGGRAMLIVGVVQGESFDHPARKNTTCVPP